VPEALAKVIDEVALGSLPVASLLPPQYALERCIAAYEAVLRACVSA
jgi:hypothetical protein